MYLIHDAVFGNVLFCNTLMCAHYALKLTRVVVAILPAILSVTFSATQTAFGNSLVQLCCCFTLLQKHIKRALSSILCLLETHDFGATLNNQHTKKRLCSLQTWQVSLLPNGTTLL